MGGFRIGGTDMTLRCVLLALCLVSSPVLAGDATAPVAAAGAADASADAAGAAGAAEAAEAAEAAAGAADTTAGASPAATGPDPWEGFNRSVFRFNERVDRYALKPVAKGYRKITPRPVRTGVANFYRNIKMPLVMLNDLLQGKPRAAGQDLSRFVVNATVGIAGIFDPSTRFGIPYNDEDFGQTLGKWGVPTGPYLVLPLIGPSTVRDGTGFAVDALGDPVTYQMEEKGTAFLWVGKAINARSNLLDVEEIIQGDRYLFLRDLYLQSREFAVKDGKVESDPFLDDEDPGVTDDGGAAAPGAEEAPAPGAEEGGASTDEGESPATAPEGAVLDNPSTPPVGTADPAADE